jgi:hypothetical protein
MQYDTVIDILPALQLSIEFRDIPRAAIDFVELSVWVL